MCFSARGRQVKQDVAAVGVDLSAPIADSSPDTWRRLQRCFCLVCGGFNDLPARRLALPVATPAAGSRWVRPREQFVCVKVNVAACYRGLNVTA